MILDSSALVAVLLREPGWQALLRRIAEDETAAVALRESAPKLISVVEAAMNTDSIPASGITFGRERTKT